MKYTEAPDRPCVDCVRLAVEMMKAPGAPAFGSARETRQATVELAGKLHASHGKGGYHRSTSSRLARSFRHSSSLRAAAKRCAPSR